MMKNDSLDNLLSSADYKKVDAFFTDSLGIPLQAVKKMKPFFIAEFPVLLRLPKTKSYEEEFIKMAKGQQKDIDKGNALGAAGYLVKPATRGQLLDAIGAALYEAKR